jgi:hypothetical protein
MRSMTYHQRPSCPCAEDLAFDPELAPLALLDAALAVAVQALIARNPEMLSEHQHLHKAPQVAAALNIVVLYREMHDAIDTYRHLLPKEPAPSGTDEFPF